MLELFVNVNYCEAFDQYHRDKYDNHYQSKIPNQSTTKKKSTNCLPRNVNLRIVQK